MSKHFIESARINFSSILCKSQSAEQYAAKMKALARHARDEYEWMEEGVTFTCLECVVVTCVNDEANLRCERKVYHTR